MPTLTCYRCLILFALLFAPTHVIAGVEKIYVLKEIDDDHIIIVTESDEKLLLEKWTMRFSPFSFEGEYFVAEVSPSWVEIHFEGRDSIKWSVEKNLGQVASKRPNESKTTPSTPARKATRGQCFRSSIREPSPFLGNGGEILILEDGTVWKEVSYQYLYLYEYNPSVIVCPGEGKMILGKNVFQIIRAK